MRVGYITRFIHKANARVHLQVKTPKNRISLLGYFSRPFIKYQTKRTDASNGVIGLKTDFLFECILVLVWGSAKKQGGL